MPEPMALRDAERLAEDRGLSTDGRSMATFAKSHSLLLELVVTTGSAEFYSQEAGPLADFMTLLAPHFPGSRMVLRRCHKEYTVVDEVRP